jgi:CBS domain-containing protein
MEASMSGYRLKDLMVRVGDYAAVRADASILEGILALKEAQRREIQDDPERHRDRAVLVKNSQGEVIGKLSMWSIIGCLEPNMNRVEGGVAASKAASRVGSARVVIEEIIESSHLWRRRLQNIANETQHLKIADLLHAPHEGELIDERASLEKAIHQLVAGHFMSLLVTKDGQIVGILRLVDVFEAICHMIECEDLREIVEDGISRAD